MTLTEESVDKHKKAACNTSSLSGGGGEIRTHGKLAPTTVFETVPFNRSGTPPYGDFGDPHWELREFRIGICESSVLGTRERRQR